MPRIWLGIFSTIFFIFSKIFHDMRVSFVFVCVMWLEKSKQTSKNLMDWWMPLGNQLWTTSNIEMNIVEKKKIFLHKTWKSIRFFFSLEFKNVVEKNETKMITTNDRTIKPVFSLFFFCCWTVCLFCFGKEKFRFKSNKSINTSIMNE